MKKSNLLFFLAFLALLIILTPFLISNIKVGLRIHAVNKEIKSSKKSVLTLQDWDTTLDRMLKTNGSCDNREILYLILKMQDATFYQCLNIDTGKLTLNAMPGSQ